MTKRWAVRNRLLAPEVKEGRGYEKTSGGVLVMLERLRC